MAKEIEVQIKRIYEKPDKFDGYRILVDRLWPRGIKKVDAHLDEWNRDIAPSSALRKWFDHRETRFAEFAHRYRYELQAKTETLERLRKLGQKDCVTLLYAAKDPDCNHARILYDLLIGNTNTQ